MLNICHENCIEMRLVSSYLNTSELSQRPPCPSRLITAMISNEEEADNEVEEAGKVLREVSVVV